MTGAVFPNKWKLHFVILHRGETIDLWYDGALKKSDISSGLTDNELKAAI